MGDAGGGRPDNSLPGGQGGRPDNTLPGGPNYPSQGPGFPTHPIAPGGGGGGGGNYPSQGPGFPTHPIHIPEVPVFPDNSLPESQPEVDNSLPGQPVYPDNALPGSQPGIDNTLPGGEREKKFKKVVVWTPQTGWVVALVPTGPTATPSE